MKSGNYCSKGVQKVARTLQDLLTISTPQIVVTQYHDGRAGQVRSEDTLATGVEAVAIRQGMATAGDGTKKGRAHKLGLNSYCMDSQLTAYSLRRQFEPTKCHL